MATQLCEYKLEDALQDLLQANATIAAAVATGAANESPFQVYIGIDEGSVDYSCVLVAANASEPIVGMGSLIGNWLVTVSIKVFTSQETHSKTDHYANLEAVRDVLLDDALQTSINTKFTGLAIGEPRMIGRSTAVNNNCWIHETTIAVPCADG